MGLGLSQPECGPRQIRVMQPQISEIDVCLNFFIDCNRYAAWYNGQAAAFGGFDDRTLVTILDVTAIQDVDLRQLKLNLENWTLADDVFASEFLSSRLIFAFPEIFYQQYARELSERLSRFDSRQGFYVVDRSVHMNCPSQGLYISFSGRLCEVFRIYEDSNGAFTLSLRETSGGSFVPLGLSGMLLNRGCVAVRSRFRQQKNPQKPLNGLRITVKDQFEISGFKNAMGSKAWFEFYPPATRTAPSIQKLIDCGAQVLGFTQLCALHQYQEPAQCIDFHDAWNPRGDGYQSPAGGSNGQASAIAAYDWLDISIASDTTLSGRIPAQANGCFGLRPTWGAVSNEGSWDGTPMFDTPSFFGRDIKMFKRFTEVWYGENLKPVSVKFPKTLLCFNDVLPENNHQQMEIFNTCLYDIESFMGVKAIWLSLEKMWSENTPAAAKGESLRSYLSPKIKGQSSTYMDWHIKIRPFYENYIHRFGKKPFFPPPAGIHRWDPAMDVTLEQHIEAMDHIQVYRKWLLEYLLRMGEQNTFVLLPLGDVKPNYRDEWNNPRGGNEQLWQSLMLSPITGSPEIVIPVGEIPFESRISGKQEYLPVCVSLMGLPGKVTPDKDDDEYRRGSCLPPFQGSDLHLIDVAEGWLRHTNRPTKVLTGSRMFQSSA